MRKKVLVWLYGFKWVRKTWWKYKSLRNKPFSNSERLQQGLDSLGKKGGVIYLSPETYEVNETIYL